MTQSRGMKRGNTCALEELTNQGEPWAALGKRQCGATSFCSVQMALTACSQSPQNGSQMLSVQPVPQRSSPEGSDNLRVQAFLASFARTRDGLHLDCPLAGPGSEFFWQGFAELNLLFEQFFQQTPGSALLSYHSFTRCAKPLVWSRFAQAYWPAGGSGAAAPLHVQVVGYVLDKAFAPYAEAQLVTYRLTVPAWLSPWCARWGLNPVELAVLAVHAYAPQAQLFGGPVEEPAVRVLYVPVVPQ